MLEQKHEGYSHGAQVVVGAGPAITKIQMRAIKKKIKQGQGLENSLASMVFYIGRPREDSLFKVAYKPRS